MPLACAGVVLALAAIAAEAAQTDIHGPPGSVAFGTYVVVLPNGNIVVTDPNRPVGPASNAGAVYLYSPAGNLISTLTGSTANDQVGNAGIVVLSNGNYVIGSPGWNNGVASFAGAVTWANGSTGITGVVSAENSLVGSSANDHVGSSGVTALSNGNYLVASSDWDNGGAADAGAVTWGHGSVGIAGVVSPLNSWTGTTAGDRIGEGGITALSGNGNYVFASPHWYNTGMAMANAGAATWGNGGMATAAAVSPLNSVVGTNADDHVGNGGVTALRNGNYVVASPYWHNGGPANAGAATWGDGSLGTAGAVSATNSLVGTSADDYVGSGGVVALSNGNYVVASPHWKNGGTPDAGAATWGHGSTGTAGAVSAANSLVGTAPGDEVGMYGVAALSNGNYVVASPNWYNSVTATASAGAATWGNGGMAIAGAVSPLNSLVGTSAGDSVGLSVTALSNGNYVVASPYWHNGGAENAGAATWGDGSWGSAGAVSAANSLIGTTAGVYVGSSGVAALSNGNYVVRSPAWQNGAAASAGAATWGSGSVGVTGVVSAVNSLVGTTADDQVGGWAVALSNGNYVVGSHSWDNGALANAGAATWGNGRTGIAGVVSAANSLVGTTTGDRVGYFGITALSNGNYVVQSPGWDNGGLVDAGAITLGRGGGGTLGPIASTNSVRGTVAGGGSTMVFAYDATRDTLVVGQPAANLVSLFKADLLFKNGFQ